jgi:hypothetical protein
MATAWDNTQGIALLPDPVIVDLVNTVMPELLSIDISRGFRGLFPVQCIG